MSDAPNPQPQQTGGETWNSRLGVILAVAGSAIGLGNFLRFPSVAAEYGGGAFIIPYLLALLLVGLPVAWVEWSIGRYGGRHGFNSLAGIFHSVSGNRFVSYLGVLGLLLPVMVYTYYIYVVGWCLGYAWFYLVGGMPTPEAADTAQFENFFNSFVGSGENGVAYSNPLESPLIFVAVAFILNFILIYRGLTKGIELFCKLAMPTLLIIAVIILVRVLTLGTPNPDKPEQNVLNGLGYMWNPVHQADTLASGDKAIGKLLRRSTADAAEPLLDGEWLTGLHVLNEKPFAWALEQAGWERKSEEDGEGGDKDSGDSDGETAGPELDSTTWGHEKTRLDIRIEGGQATFVGSAAEDLTLETEDAAVRSLLDMLPRDVAEAETADGRVQRIAIEDAAGFEEALTAVGWKAADEQPDRYKHPSSRLAVRVESERATIHAPGFWQMLAMPGMWLAAAGQIFFSLSVGFGVIATYASYMKPDDDVALSGLTAATGNGFCEIVLAGLTIVPAGFIFLGASFVANPPGTFGVGFVSLPAVFNDMPGGQLVGFLFFFLLFLAAMTSTISLLQPGIAFLEEGLGLGRRAAVAFLGLFTALGVAFVMYFSKGFTALGTIDFWTANVGIVVLATIAVIVYGWVLGLDRGLGELRRGAEIPVPTVVGYIIKFVSPLFLLTILVINFSGDIVKKLRAAFEDTAVGLSFGLFVITLIFFLLLVMQAVKRWNTGHEPAKEVRG